MRSLLTLGLIACTSIIYAQNQLGADLLGDVTEAEFGHCVSLSTNGQFLAIGAPFHYVGEDTLGLARVFEWSGSEWQQIGADILGDSNEDNMGFSVSLSGNGQRLAVGTPWDSDNGNAAGLVRVFQWEDSSWQQIGADLNGEAGDNFGGAITLSSNGNRMAVGAIGYDGVGFSDGQVKVFNWNGMEWQPLGEPLVGETSLNFFGGAVALSGNGQRLIVGARGNDEIGMNAGHVRVFEWNGIAWLQVGTDIDGEAAGDGAGASVSISADGQRIAIGAPGNDNSFDGAGQVRIYDWSGSNWQQVGTDLKGNAALDALGYTVSLSADGQRVAIGAPFSDENGNSTGQARIYGWINDSWQQLGEYVYGADGDNRFGFFLSISGDGQTLAVGAPRNDANGEDAGLVRVFDLSELSSTIQLETATISIAPNPTNGFIQIAGYQPDTLTVFDLNGRPVISFNKPDSEIDLSHLPSGFYFLQIEIDGQTGSAKLYKQ